jgi:ABC-type lipoprotein release transport system permease subunit
MMGVAMRPVWHGIYRFDILVTPVLMLFFVVFVAVLYPALKAAWIQPVEAMHHL